MRDDPTETVAYADPDPEPEPHRSSLLPWVVAVLVAIAGVAGAVLLWLRVQVAQADAARTATALAAATAEQAQLAKRVEQLEAEKADLAALRSELSSQVAAKQEELQKLQGTYQELESKMKEEIAKGDVRLSQAGGRIKVDLVDEILFDVGDASINTRGEGVLSRVGGVLANVADRKIQVSGHTDDLPISERLHDRYPTNWELASARATNVVRFLEEKAGIPGRRLVAAAYGPWEPISSNRTAKGRARNRRIEIVLTPQLAPAPIDAAVVKAAAPGPAKAAAPKKAPVKKDPKKKKP
jgi:chemotaxis protein MotB